MLFKKVKSVIDDIETRMMEEMEEIEEDIDLYNFVESPECGNAIKQYFIHKTVGKGAGNEEVISKATKLWGILTFNTHVLGCILSGEVVCVDGAFYPGDINKADNNS